MRHTISWSVIGTAVIGIAVFWVFQEQSSPSNTIAPASPAAFRPPPPPIDIAGIEGQLNYTPTPEDLAEAARQDRQQVEQAGQWLQDADSSRRVTGAEQLSAYPTPEAEKLLAGALHDTSPLVRTAAAQSLDVFNKPQDGTLKTLLAALEDPDAGVRLAALGTLETYYSRSPQAKRIVAGLRKASNSPRVALESQQVILDFLHDQE